MISASRYSAFQLVFGANPVGLRGWGGRKEDLLFGQDTSGSGKSAQQWKLRVTAREAALKEVADCKLVCLLAHNKTFDSADAKLGDSALFFKAPNRNSHPNWRGPARILDVDELKSPRFFQVRPSKWMEEEVGCKEAPPGLEPSRARYRTELPRALNRALN